MQLYLALPSTVLKINMVCNMLKIKIINFMMIVMGLRTILQTYKSEHFFKVW
jgi:hypothetical protein